MPGLFDSCIGGGGSDGGGGGGGGGGGEGSASSGSRIYIRETCTMSLSSSSGMLYTQLGSSDGFLECSPDAPASSDRRDSFEADFRKSETGPRVDFPFTLADADSFLVILEAVLARKFEAALRTLGDSWVLNLDGFGCFSAPSGISENFRELLSESLSVVNLIDSLLDLPETVDSLVWRDITFCPENTEAFDTEALDAGLDLSRTSKTVFEPPADPGM